MTRGAASAGGKPPKALVKMGHWHTLRGIGPANIPTFGNFLSELARTNGMDSLVVPTYVHGSPDAYRNVSGQMAEIFDPSGILLVDLRPLRPAVDAGALDGLEGRLRSLVFRSDMLLLFSGAGAGSYAVACGEEPESR